MKFAVGDRVICIRPEWGVQVGEVGTVVKAWSGNSLTDTGVRWDNYDDIRHDCDGLCDRGHGLWFYPSKMERLDVAENEDLGDICFDELTSLLF